jgi:hypothetical protein
VLEACDFDLDPGKTSDPFEMIDDRLPRITVLNGSTTTEGRDGAAKGIGQSSEATRGLDERFHATDSCLTWVH